MTNQKYNFHNKKFRVVKNDGPGAEVNENTIFNFQQEGNVIHADYYGGKVKVGKFLGIISGDTINFRYIQVNTEGQFQTGHSTDKVQIKEKGKLRLIDEWEWETKEGKGFCIMEEI